MRSAMLPRCALKIWMFSSRSRNWQRPAGSASLRAEPVGRYQGRAQTRGRVRRAVDGACGRSLALTPAGHLVHAAKELSELTAAMRRDMAGEMAALRGAIRLGTVRALLGSVAASAGRHAAGTSVRPVAGECQEYGGAGAHAARRQARLGGVLRRAARPWGEHAPGRIESPRLFETSLSVKPEAPLALRPASSGAPRFRWRGRRRAQLRGLACARWRGRHAIRRVSRLGHSLPHTGSHCERQALLANEPTRVRPSWRCG
jgi:hypothetical protein